MPISELVNGAKRSFKCGSKHACLQDKPWGPVSCATRRLECQLTRSSQWSVDLGMTIR